ncbi:putative transcription factor bZIP family [Dioscorea sansibarensis]
MHPCEVAGMQYITPMNHHFTNFNLPQNTLDPLIPNSATFFPSHAPPPHPLNFHHLHQELLTPTPSSLSTNSTSDDADDHHNHHNSLADERRRRRMISNRESARRSRMRKQRQLDDLFAHVLHLRSANHQLIDDLNHVIKDHSRILQENAQLREEATSLQNKLRLLQADHKNDSETHST